MKRRKTRQEKIIAQLRRQVSTESAITTHAVTKQEAAPSEKRASYQLPKFATLPTTNRAVLTQSYMYLPQELRKTAMLVGVIVAFQLLLFYLLRAHIVTLPFASY